MMINSFIDKHARVIIVIFISIITIALVCSVCLKRTSGDFDIYYQAGKNYLERQPVYIPHDGGIEEFKYSPFFSLVFSPFAMLPKTTALYCWSILNIFLLYLIFYFLFRLGLMLFKRASDFWLLFLLFALAGRYIFINIKIGQVNIALCFLLTLVMYFQIRNKDFWAGFFLALSLMIKLFPAIFLVYFVLRKRFKIIYFTALMCVVFLFIPSFYSGFGLELRYIREWFDLLRSTPPGIIYSVKNSSLLSYFSWLFVVQHQGVPTLDFQFISRDLPKIVYYFWMAGCLTLFTVFFRDSFLKKDMDSEQQYMDYSCLLVCGLLFNPLAYLNALVILIIPYFFILRYAIYFAKSRRFSVMLWALIIGAFIVTMLNNKVFFSDVNDFYRVLEYKLPMWTMILVYFSLLLVKSKCKKEGVCAGRLIG